MADFELLKAQSSLVNDSEAAKVFKFILDRSTASGWMIVKELGQETEQTEGSLKKLRSLGLLEGSGEGLDGFYHSTSMGYAVREALSI
jgi:hypothetical protein